MITDLVRRKREHINKAKNGSDCAFHRAIMVISQSSYQFEPGP